MSDVVTIDGTVVDLNDYDAIILAFSDRFGSIPTFTMQRRGIALPSQPDPWLAKTITWANDATGSSVVYFSGDIVSSSPSYDERIGWILTYQCLGLRNRMDWFPHTDSNTGIESSSFNVALEVQGSGYNPEYIPSREGRTVGQILELVLTMLVNVQTLSGYGIGDYSGLPTNPTLPAQTLTDLSLMTVIPPQQANVSGEKLGAAIDGFLQQWAPNFRMWIEPTTGILRFRDIRTFPATTFTMGQDPIEPTPLAADLGECFSRIAVRGQPIAIMAVFKQSNGTLLQNFAWGTFTNAQAIANWNPAQFQQPGASQDTGTCTDTSTTQIVVTSSNSSRTWAANYWDQSHAMGVINLRASTLTGVNQYWTARVTANTALTAGGTSTLTIDAPLPALVFDQYTLSGLLTDGSVVWTQYQIADEAIWPAVTNVSTYPQPFVSASGAAASLISSPLGIVFWSSNGSPPYASFPVAFTYNPTTGNVRFNTPLYFIANNSPPADVWVALPVNVNPNLVLVPANDGSGNPVYDGTSFTVNGLEKTLTVTLMGWRDPSIQSQVQTFAEDLLDTVKNTVYQGAIVYYGLYSPALTFGTAANIAGKDASSYPTGWENLNLPVVGVTVEWPQTEGMAYKTTIQCSNRLDHFAAEMFLHPQRQCFPIGMGEGTFNPSGISQPGQFQQHEATSQGNLAEVEAVRNGQMSPESITGESGSQANALASMNPGAAAAQQGVTPGQIAAGAQMPSQLAPANLASMVPNLGGIQSGIGNMSSNFGQFQTDPTAYTSSDVPTSPGQYMQGAGIPTSFSDLGLPQSPSDLGIPTSPAEYFGLTSQFQPPAFPPQPVPTPAPTPAEPAKDKADDAAIHPADKGGN